MPDSSSFPPDEMAGRLARIRDGMTADGLDALITVDAANVRYATGFRGEPRTLLVTADQALLCTSFRTLPWAEEQCGPLGSHIEFSTASNPWSLIRKRLPQSPQSVGLDPFISHHHLLDWQAQLAPHTLRPAPVIERARQRKSPAEVDRLRASQRLNESIFNAVLPRIRPGMSERAVQGLILAEMAAREEVDRYAFIPIVAAGPNSWEIHHLPDKTVIQRNDMLLIDLGVVREGYASDMTRTVCLGHATEEMRDVHHTVGEAQQAAIAAMRSGASSHEIDRLARDIITRAGHGRSFTHGLGHGIGLETHDPGLNLSPRSPETVLEAGMALTVEPGIYIENNFGVRTEDVVVVTAGGHTNLTAQSSALLELPL